MTYKEKYMNCESVEQLESVVNEDITYAKMINTDRVPRIIKACEEVLVEKFNKQIS